MFFERNGFLKELEYRIRKFFARKGTAKICGHEACSIGKLSDGSILEFCGDELLYCHDCLSKMGTTCACCHGPINIGDSVRFVVLTSPPDVSVEISEHSSVVHVACTRCAEFGDFDAQGIWVPSGENDGKGMVSRTTNITEQILAGDGEVGAISDGKTTKLFPA